MLLWFSLRSKSYPKEGQMTAEALRFWNHEAEAEAEALASNASASSKLKKLPTHVCPLVKQVLP